MPASPGASPLIPRWAWWTLLGAVLGVAVSGVVLYQHASVWMRGTPAISRCLGTTRLLKRPELVSGIEPHDTPSGETVWLRPNEDRVVRCMSGTSIEQAQRLAAAFAELDDEPRAEALAALVRDFPPEAEHDRIAYSMYLAASGALAGLPQDLPAVVEATKEVDGIMDCRFYREGPCAARPSIPILVWVPGVPAALALLLALGVFSRAGVMAIARKRQRKRQERAARRARRRARREARAARLIEARKAEARKAAAKVLATPESD